MNGKIKGSRIPHGVRNDRTGGALEGLVARASPAPLVPLYLTLWYCHSEQSEESY